MQPSNTALVSDACASALRAFYNAPQHRITRWIGRVSGVATLRSGPPTRPINADVRAQVTIQVERPLETKVRDVMEAMGRSLRVYQQIELQLKVLLPHMVGPGREMDDSFAEWTSLLHSKTTLGQLVKRLDASVQSSDPEGFRHYLGKLVRHRNELIHHFYELPFGWIRTAQECDAALTHLNQRIQFALAFHQSMRGLLAQFLIVLADSILADGNNVP
jgi:hypothetical protein